MNDVFVDFVVSYPVFFGRMGSVEFKYRKDNFGNKIVPYGAFKFSIDDNPVLVDEEFNDDWQVFKMDDIMPGYHNLEWTYSKFNDF